MFKTPILMLKMTFFWLLFRGKFEQKTQKSISFKNQWRLKNIKKAMVVKNIIAEDMPFTKSIFEQFWRSYCKKTIFVVFHFLKFLPIYELRNDIRVVPLFSCMHPPDQLSCSDLFIVFNLGCNNNQLNSRPLKTHDDSLKIEWLLWYLCWCQRKEK